MGLNSTLSNVISFMESVRWYRWVRIPSPDPSLLGLDIERAHDLAPAGDFGGHIAREAGGIGVEGLGGVL
jgi:hypothetical protein